MMQFSIWTIVLLLSQAAFQCTAAVKPVAVECNPPVLSTVAVDEPHHRYYPYFIRLHRCEGSYGYESPNIKKCVVTESREVTFSVYDTTNRLSTQIRLQNHTKCGPECKASPLDCDLKVQEWNDESCQCKCLYPRSPPPDDVVKPKKGFGWNNHLCRYECNTHERCPLEKIWNKKKCSCVCTSFYEHHCKAENKLMDPKTCACKDPMKSTAPRPGFMTYVESKVLAVFLALAIVVICLITYLWYRSAYPKYPFGSSGKLNESTSSAESVGQSCENAGVRVETQV